MSALLNQPRPFSDGRFQAVFLMMHRGLSPAVSLNSPAGQMIDTEGKSRYTAVALSRNVWRISSKHKN